MILESGANTIILTLNELKTLDAPEYVIVFQCISTAKKVACKLGTDLSDYPVRNNKFTLTVKTSPNPLNAEVNLETYRSYKYFVYERVDADVFDFAGIDSVDLDTLTGEVERNLMDYITEDTDLDYYKNIRTSITSNE